MIDHSEVLRKKSHFKQGTETDGVVALDLAATLGRKSRTFGLPAAWRPEEAEACAVFMTTILHMYNDLAHQQKWSNQLYGNLTLPNSLFAECARTEVSRTGTLSGFLHSRPL